MDIDDFLDKELTEMSSPELPASDAQARDKADTPLFESVKDYLEKGNIDEAEKAYIELWHALGKKNLKWDKSLHQQLSLLNRQFSSSIMQSLEEMKRKAIQVKELISRARQSLRDGKKEESLKIYSEVQSVINTIPKIFFEEKKAMQDQVLSLYRELMLNSESEILKKIQSLLNDLNGEIASTHSAIQKGDTESAVQGYKRCIALFTGIPEGFLRQRNPLGVQLLEIYRAISIQSEIKELQKQIGFSPLFSQQMPPQTAPISIQRQPRPNQGREMLKRFETRKQEIAPHPELHRHSKPQMHKTEEAPNPKPEVESSTLEQPPKMPEPVTRLPEPPKMPELTARMHAPRQAQQSSLPPPPPPSDYPADEFESRIDNAKKNIDRGLFNEASKEVEGALRIKPQDVEAKALRAKIKAWQ